MEKVEEKSKYTRKIEIPIYEPKNEIPGLGQMYNRSKCRELTTKIKESNVPDKIKEFLYSAAERHTQFNFSKIADYYAHADFETKKLFEESALVIIDYNDAIRNGFVSYQKEVDEDLEEYLDDLEQEDMEKNLDKANAKSKPILNKELKKLF